MLIQEGIEAVLEGLNIQTDDSGIPDEYVYFMLNAARKELLKQEGDKDRLWDGFSSSLVRMTLEKSTVSETDDFDADIVVYKSKEELPELIDTKHGKIITNIFFDNGAKVYKSSFASMVNSKRYFDPPTQLKYFPRGNKLYVYNLKSDTDCVVVNMEAIVDDPAQIAIRNDDCVDISQTSFGVPGYLERRVIAMAVQNIREKYGMPADTQNNSQNDINLAQTQ